MRTTMILVAFLLAAAPAAADILVLTDGAVLVGELIEEDRRALTFRYRIQGAWTTASFSRSRVDDLVVEVGDQSDLGAADRDAADGDDDAGAGIGGRDERRDRDGSAPRSKRSVAVIPLHGQVGGTVDDRLRGTFDARILEQCLEEAEREHAELVILDVRSPGGLVAEMERICETIVDWHHRLRIVAYPDDAYSAAAIICLSCRELAVRPGSTFGAAVIVTRGEDGMSAVDAKMASPHYAKQRTYTAASGQPYEVVKAMMIQEAELWWSPAEGFATARENAGGPAQWEQVDDATSVLTVTADEALRWKIAVAEAEDVEALAAALDVTGEFDVISYGATIRDYTNAIDDEYAGFRESLLEYFAALNGIRTGMEAYLEAHNRRDEAGKKTYAAEVNRSYKAANAAARRVEKADHAILARRVAVPEDMIERIQTDRRLLKNIPRLVRSSKPDAFNGAARRFNEIINAWTEILGDGG